MAPPSGACSRAMKSAAEVRMHQTVLDQVSGRGGRFAGRGGHLRETYRWALQSLKQISREPVKPAPRLSVKATG